MTESTVESTWVNLVPLCPDNYYDWFDLSSRPLLNLARKNTRPAHSVRVEWLVDYFENGTLRRRALTNYTQILRRAFRQEPKEDGTRELFVEAAKRCGEQILDDIELTLWYGKPSYTLNPFPLSTCGGVLHYLKRRVYENDYVVLRELRQLSLLTGRGENDQFKAEEDQTHEWLVELSLEVVPGHYERGMVPVCLPPAPKPPTLNAYAQGAQLEVAA